MTVLDTMEDGTRLGRYVLLRDAEGRRHALAVTSVVALSETDDGDTLLHLSGGRMLRTATPLTAALAWFTLGS